jgi:hypothetical protein
MAVNYHSKSFITLAPDPIYNWSNKHLGIIALIHNDGITMEWQQITTVKSFITLASGPSVLNFFCL